MIEQQPPPVVTRVWDLPVRIVHWLMVALLIILVATAKIGGDAIVGLAVFSVLGALTIAVSVLVFLRRPRGLAPAPLLESG